MVGISGTLTINNATSHEMAKILILEGEKPAGVSFDYRNNMVNQSMPKISNVTITYSSFEALEHLVHFLQELIKTE